MTELHWLSATEALDRFRARELSPVEYIEAVLARAEAVEPDINAFGDTFFDEAMYAAREAEARYMGRGPKPRPLEGIAVAVKEESAVKGQRATQGSLVYKDYIPDYTIACVERIIGAGGIVHARSTAPEFSIAAFTHSHLWGVTRNPWNLNYSAGGSSGGSGASLAAASTTLATGSDIAGSVRIPASFCGVVGFKPPYGRIPEDPPFNLDHYCVEGPMARTVADCVLLENIMAGPHPSDAASLRPKLTIPPLTGDIEGWRIALSADLGGFPVDDDVAANTLAAAEAFRGAGAVVEEVDLGWDQKELIEAARIHLGLLYAVYVQREVDEHPDLVTPYVVNFARESAAITKEDVVRGMQLEVKIYERLAAVLEETRLLICPTFAVPALEAGDDYIDHGPQVNGRPTDSTWDVLMTAPFNICGRCPVMSVPSGFARSGVPTGLQIVGRTYCDVDVFQAATAFEGLRPWLMGPDDRPHFVR
jgi:Asp-tRNA(Asn)/Glu-tRNA(Gln) amidotransferase A subunit family amidase